MNESISNEESEIEGADKVTGTHACAMQQLVME
jgi:hypothetical protein